MPVIEVSHLTKEYRLGALHSLKQTLLNTGARLIGKRPEERPLFKALDDVTFSIEQGEVVGIIGHNGAGKSTLLKMLARISTPTSGALKVDGRIAPLIEVGAGFVADFTGRENVYLNGSIHGMSKKEIDRKFDEIVEFAEMAEFIDTPVKRYSSGMQVKLAFSVATSLDSEILIVDEVLAVGDLAFQRKCFDRMEELIKRQGRTVLLVSHNIRHVERICNRVIIMDHGRILADGDPHETCNLFYQINDERISQQKKQAAKENAITRSSGEARLIDTTITDPEGNVIDEVEHGSDVVVHLTYETSRALQKPVFLLGIHTTDFIYIGTARSQNHLSVHDLDEGVHKISCRINKFPFLPGVYAFRTDLIVGDLYSTAFRAENVHPFKVVAAQLNRSEHDAEGFVPLATNWMVTTSTAQGSAVGKSNSIT